MYDLWDTKLNREYSGNLEFFCSEYLVPLLEKLGPEFAASMSIAAAAYVSSRKGESKLVKLVESFGATRKQSTE